MERLPGTLRDWEVWAKAGRRCPSSPACRSRICGTLRNFPSLLGQTSYAQRPDDPCIRYKQSWRLQIGQGTITRAHDWFRPKGLPGRTTVLPAQQREHLQHGGLKEGRTRAILTHGRVRTYCHRFPQRRKLVDKSRLALRKHPPPSLSRPTWLSRSPSASSAVPRLSCVIAQSSGSRSRVNSSSAA